MACSGERSSSAASSYACKHCIADAAAGIAQLACCSSLHVCWPILAHPCHRCCTLQVDEALKTASSVSEVLELTLPVLKPETLDAPPRPLVDVPQQLEFFGAELPPPALSQAHVVAAPL